MRIEIRARGADDWSSDKLMQRMYSLRQMERVRGWYVYLRHCQMLRSSQNLAFTLVTRLGKKKERGAIELSVTTTRLDDHAYYSPA